MIYYVLMVIGVILIWTPGWNDIRYIIPVLWFMSFGIVWLICRIKTKWVRPWVLAGVVLLMVVAQVAQYRKRTDEYHAYYEHWSAFALATSEVVPPEAVVVSNKPQIYYLLSSRRAIRYPYTNDTAAVRLAIAGCDYAMLDRIGNTSYLMPVIQGWDIIMADQQHEIYLARRPHVKR